MVRYTFYRISYAHIAVANVAAVCSHSIWCACETAHTSRPSTNARPSSVVVVVRTIHYILMSCVHCATFRTICSTSRTNAMRLRAGSINNCNLRAVCMYTLWPRRPTALMMTMKVIMMLTALCDTVPMCLCYYSTLFCI